MIKRDSYKHRFFLGLVQGVGIVIVLLIAAGIYKSSSTMENFVKRQTGQTAVSKAALQQYKPSEALNNPYFELIRSAEQIPVPHGFRTIRVSTSRELIEFLESNQANTAVIFASGEYEFKQTLQVRAKNVMFISETGNPNDVVFKGHGMKKYHKVRNLIDVKAEGFVLDGITLADSGNHLIQIRGEANAHFPVIRNCILRDSYEQLIKVSYKKMQMPDNYSGSGLVENCVFYYSEGVGPNYYIGGIDAHAIRHWIIRNNLFKDIASPSNRIAEHAIHIWNNSESNIVEGNVIIDSDRAIGKGMHKRTKGNEDKNIRFSNYGGVIRGNYIYHSDNNDLSADVGIILEKSPFTQVRENMIYQEHSYPRAIEVRFDESFDVVVEGNKTNKSIKSRNGGVFDSVNNEEDVEKIDFIMSLSQKLDTLPLSRFFALDR